MPATARSSLWRLKAPDSGLSPDESFSPTKTGNESEDEKGEWFEKKKKKNQAKQTEYSTNSLCCLTLLADVPG